MISGYHDLAENLYFKPNRRYNSYICFLHLGAYSRRSNHHQGHSNSFCLDGLLYTRNPIFSKSHFRIKANQTGIPRCNSSLDYRYGRHVGSSWYDTMVCFHCSSLPLNISHIPSNGTSWHIFRLQILPRTQVIHPFHSLFFFLNCSVRPKNLGGDPNLKAWLRWPDPST